MSEQRTARLRAWAGARWFDAALAAMLGAVAVVALLARDGIAGSAVAVLEIVLVCAPVAVMRRNPLAAAGAAAAVIFVAEVIGDDTDYPDAVLLVVLALSYACGAFAPSVVGGLGMAILLAVLQITSGIPDGTWLPLLFSTVGPWLTGRAVRSRSELVAALAARTHELEAEQDAFARLAVRHERARIARELHDIVAHNLAVMVVQAGAGRMASPEQHERAAERFSSIAEAGGQALSEMARLVDILHAENGGRDHRRRQLELVLDQAQAAGLNVHATPLPRGVELPPELEETAHRVVQEGVTNALKHASGADVHVRLAVRDGDLEIEVRDSGGRTRPTLAGTGAGLGLTGLRERVTAAGGRLDAGPAADGGWRLHARLPSGDRPIVRAG